MKVVQARRAPVTKLERDEHATVPNAE